MNYDILNKALSDRLKNPLPAHLAHQLIMKGRSPIDSLGDVIHNAKQSAVLCLVYPADEEWKIVYIQRPKYEGVHSAQIGFPGGKKEEGDINYRETALREANEELNIHPRDVEVLGGLSPLYVPPSNFLIHPFLAIQAHRPDFIMEEREVSGIIELPLKHLLDKNNLLPKEILVRNHLFVTNGFQYKEHFIWGATAMISMEIVQLLKELNLYS